MKKGLKIGFFVITDCCCRALLVEALLCVRRRSKSRRSELHRKERIYIQDLGRKAYSDRV